MSDTRKGTVDPEPLSDFLHRAVDGDSVQKGNMVDETR